MFDTPWVVLPQIDPACVSIGACPIGERMKRVLTDMLAHYMSLQLEYMAETGGRRCGLVDCSDAGGYDAVHWCGRARRPGITDPHDGARREDAPGACAVRAGHTPRRRSGGRPVRGLRRRGYMGCLPVHGSLARHPPPARAARGGTSV